MRILTIAAAALLASCAAVPAYAANYRSTPVAAENDETYYKEGVAILRREVNGVRIAIKANPAYFGRPAFAVQVVNNTDAAFNFGPEHVAVSVDGETKPTVVYTNEQLVAQAHNKAFWSGLLAAAASASAGTSSYSSTTRTPYGTYRSSGTYYNSYAADAKQEKYEAVINNNLAARVTNIQHDNIQMTTIEPGVTYAAGFVTSKPKAKLPGRVTVVVLGEVFTFDMRK